MSIRFPFLRSIALAALVVTLGAARMASAQAAKIGYFDVKRVLTELEDAKAAKARLEGELKKKQKQLDEMKADLEKAQRELEQKKPVLAPSALAAAEGDLMQKAQAAQKLYFELQQDLAAKEQQAIVEVMGRLEPVVREIADAEGYAYVFEKENAGLIVAPSSGDLTSQVIRKYNQKHPQGAKGGGKK